MSDEPVPPLDPDRGDLVHTLLGEIPESQREVVAALLELPNEYEVTHGITVADLVIALVTERIEPAPVMRALVALDLVRPGLGGAP